VSARFTAPIVGALVALGVVLRHFAVHAFAPIVIASVAGTVINRLEFGGVTEFSLRETGNLQFYQELPAFLLLGLVCGIVSVLLMRAIFLAEDLGTAMQSRTGLPRWMRPAVAGAMLGGLAVWFPHIIGVGYETTSAALTGQLLWHEALVFAVLKCVAVAVTIAGRMGGGVFSPSLMVGALGAVAAAVLGAPISTTLIVFELTGDWQTGLAVMVSVSISTAISSRLVDRSFFLTQLERRDVHLAAGPQAYLLAMFRAGTLMRKPGDPGAANEDACREMIEDGIAVDFNATLEEAIPMFERAGVPFLPVTTQEAGQPRLLGALFHVDALKSFNKALAATAAEEHS
jgi:CIC family chloride channel protein